MKRRFSLEGKTSEQKKMVSIKVFVEKDASTKR